MIAVIVGLCFLLLCFAPQIWTRYIFRRYATPIADLPGSGGQLVEHLIKELQLSGTKLEETERGSDHYDPETRTIRLSPENLQGKSLTAVVIAAHEVGHALQHAQGYPPLYLRWRVAKIIRVAEKLGSILLIVFPFAAVLTRLPLVGGALLAAGVLILLLPVVLHAVTLPVEFDASFNRALPLLFNGGYLPASATAAARQILAAAALTYLAASLASILNFYRWVVFLRR